MTARPPVFPSRLWYRAGASALSPASPDLGDPDLEGPDLGGPDLTVPPSATRRRVLGGLSAVGAAGLVGGLAACSPRADMAPMHELMLGAPLGDPQDETAELLRRSFGGRYQDARLHAYIATVGRLMGGESQGPGANYAFVVLNHPSANMFVLPNGTMFLTRGLLAYVNSEAALAALLGFGIRLRESGVAGRHWNQWYRQSQRGNLQSRLLTGTDLFTMTLLLTSPVTAPLSRNTLRDIDLSVARRMRDVGYDPMALVEVAASLGAAASLEATIDNRPDRPLRLTFARLYPRSLNLLADAIREMEPGEGPPTSTDRFLYLQQVDGLRFGSDPTVGYFDAGSYVAPDLGLTVQLPPGFEVAGGTDIVTAFGPDGSGLSLDVEESPRLQRAHVYLRQIFARQLYLRDRLRGVQQVEINGREAAIGRARLDADNGPMDFRLVCLRVGRNLMARMVSLTPPQLTPALTQDIQRTSQSLRPLRPEEAETFRPFQLRVVTVREGDTLSALARQMPYREFAQERLAALNGLGPNARLRPGQRLKVVVG